MVDKSESLNIWDLFDIPTIEEGGVEAYLKTILLRCAGWFEAKTASVFVAESDGFIRCQASIGTTISKDAIITEGQGIGGLECPPPVGAFEELVRQPQLQRARRQPGESDGDRQEEQHLDVKNQKQNGVKVVMGFELNPRITRGRDAAFVDGTLVEAGFRRLEKAEPQLRHRQQSERKARVLHFDHGVQEMRGADHDRTNLGCRHTAARQHRADGIGNPTRDIRRRRRLDRGQNLAAAQQCGVRSSYVDPAALGPDRWAALIGAWHLTGGACVVVNAGTTMTVDALNGEGVFLGGCIVPGAALMREALARDTANLALRAGARVVSEPVNKALLQALSEQHGFKVTSVHQPREQRRA